MNAKHLEKLTPEAQEIISKNSLHLLTLGIADKYENTYLLGILVKLLGIDPSLVESEIREVFRRK